MRFFNAPIQVKTHPIVLQKARRFAIAVVNTVDYSDSRQAYRQKVEQDHYISKIGEEAVVSVFKQYTSDVASPDYRIYSGALKNWANDLTINATGLAVKTQTRSSANRYGLSWTFQCGTRRRDPILKLPEAWVCFVECNDLDQSFDCTIYPPYQIKDLEFKDPQLPHLLGEKAVIYAKDLKHTSQ